MADLETKVRKLKLKPLTDEIRYDIAIKKENVYLYDKYDYYFTDNNGGHYLFSRNYLESTPYRQLVKGHRRSRGKDLQSRIDSIIFKLDLTRVKMLNRLLG